MCPASQKVSELVETKVRNTEVQLMAHQGSRWVRKVRQVGRICMAMMAEDDKEEEVRPWPPGFLPL